jgi:hypothetical protein
MSTTIEFITALFCQVADQIPDIPKHPQASLWGFVANFAQEVEKGQLPLSVRGLSGQGVEQLGRSEAFVFSLHYHLSFLDHVHELNPNECVLSGLERFKPQHGSCHPLYASMILLHNVIEILSSRMRPSSAPGMTFVFSVCRLVSRRCHTISAIHQLRLKPSQNRTSGLPTSGSSFNHSAWQKGSG